MYLSSSRGWGLASTSKTQKRCTDRRADIRHRDTCASCCVCCVSWCTCFRRTSRMHVFSRCQSTVLSFCVKRKAGYLERRWRLLLIRVPVYGLCDSGRGLRKKVGHDAKVGLGSRRIFPALYFHIENGAVDVVLTTHVDDFL